MNKLISKKTELVNMALPSASSLDACSIGLFLNQDCHKFHYCRKAGLLKVTDFSEEDKELMQWRCGYQFHNDDKVCFHHEKLYLTRYESLQKYCADPFTVHNKHITSKF